MLSKAYVKSIVIYCFVLFILSGGSQMCAAEELILSEESIVANDAIVHSIELYSEEQSLGVKSLPSVPLKEGTITYMDGFIQYLSPDKQSPLQWSLYNDKGKWDMYFIRFPFTLHPTPENRYYKQVDFSISISDKSVTAYDLFPTDITSKEEIGKSVVIAPEGKFKDVQLNLGSYNTTVKFTRLQPEITAFGVGENNFSWRYSSLGSSGILPGTKHALIILKVPHGVRQVNGEIYFKVVMVKPWLGNWCSTNAHSEKRPFTWKLPFP
jgi:hypothetical protein